MRAERTERERERRRKERERRVGYLSPRGRVRENVASEGFVLT